MKTYKYIWLIKKSFNYKFKNNNIDHGFFNNRNSWVGYYYQDEQKGFWLTEEN